MSDVSEFFKLLPKFTDYKFIFASQDGEFAWRSRKNGSFFIRSLCELLVDNAHDTHLDNIVKMMLSNFEKFKDTDEVREQMPEEWSSMPRFLNLFPGVTQEYLNKPEPTSEKRTTYSLMIPPLSSQSFAWPAKLINRQRCLSGSGPLVMPASMHIPPWFERKNKKQEIVFKKDKATLRVISKRC